MKRIYLILLAGLFVPLIVLAQPPKKPNFFQQGMQHYNKQEYAAAIADFQKFINTLKPPVSSTANPAAVAPPPHPKKAEAYYYIANSFRKQNNLEAALTNYTKAIEVRPEFPQALMERGTLYMEQKRYDLAVPDFQKVVQLAPDNIDAHYQLGMAYSLLQNYQAAIPELTRVIELNPQHAYGHYYLGLAYSKIKQPGNAQTHLQIFLNLCPTCPEAAMARSFLSHT
jgi:tetratricopeptide (TPR) repeat protein